MRGIALIAAGLATLATAAMAGPAAFAGDKPREGDERENAHEHRRHGEQYPFHLIPPCAPYGTYEDACRLEYLRPHPYGMLTRTSQIAQRKRTARCLTSHEADVA